MQSYYWREGFEAAESGKSIDDNPYTRSWQDINKELWSLVKKST